MYMYMDMSMDTGIDMCWIPWSNNILTKFDTIYICVSWGS
jgi:hypothetical protein